MNNNSYCITVFSISCNISCYYIVITITIYQTFLRPQVINMQEKTIIRQYDYYITVSFIPYNTDSYYIVITITIYQTFP